MKPSTTDQVEGKLHEVKGDIKQKAGRATHNPNLENEGTDEKTAGKVQKKIGQAEKAIEKSRGSAVAGEASETLGRTVVALSQLPCPPF